MSELAMEGHKCSHLVGSDRSDFTRSSEFARDGSLGMLKCTTDSTTSGNPVADFGGYNFDDTDPWVMYVTFVDTVPQVGEVAGNTVEA
jgi:hypothetical protein